MRSVKNFMNKCIYILKNVFKYGLCIDHSSLLVMTYSKTKIKIAKNLLSLHKVNIHYKGWGKQSSVLNSYF